ncbi:MAG: hypothetical protein NVV66_08440 [Cellulomonas sp.]|uniref:hypothetical protein n=1 Tax=Cellulomonas sp. TaxID=40001 RepID=UPI00258390AC|nr:hypothetical protein [Cellulomonas sp.]MCR6704712.1 hypothetical protein [Cellulomonas sp.]
MYLTDDYYAFLSRMREGDVVLARHDDHVWLGRLAGPATYADEAPACGAQSSGDRRP